jgi:hypothetical protein
MILNSTTVKSPVAVQGPGLIHRDRPALKPFINSAHASLARMDQFWQADWGEFYAFFAQGSPPLAIQILIINTIFFILWIIRRMRGARALRRQTSIAVQAILIGANTVILLQQNLFG